ncbi:hypothetical protein F511_44286 [Dorcoceras hygrometricum]|uniref:Uncharacterized protein n=1 Tax=Dorcoceras hygrometricum TaxID=472368 RepID=A0A2Z6ZZ95_9LAMI|nr:hypothetical protein F511_44286 [Dorcoceras hygrometricum]
MLAAGCPVVGREMLATRFPNDCTKAKRCRIHLSKRHRFAIANFKYHLLVNSSLRLDTSSCTTSLYLLRFSSQLLIAFAQLLIVMTSLLMSSSLFEASSSRHVDGMDAESRFLSISNANAIVAARSFFQ